MRERVLSRREWLFGTGAALAGLGMAGCSGSHARRLPNIVVLLADTLRADHLSCYGHSPRTSPNIDALAERGTVFENYVSAATWTKPSIGTMFVGLAPRSHRAVIFEGSIKDLMAMKRFRVQALKNGFVTIAEALKQQGYRNAYFQCNPHGHPAFGYAQGFDEANFRAPYPMRDQLRDAMMWTTRESGSPFFVFIHELDPHNPYVPHPDAFESLHGVTMEEARSEVPPDEAEDMKNFFWKYNDEGPKPNLAPETRRYFEMLYDAEIYMVDAQLRRLIRFFERQRLIEDTIFVITSDHGEGFLEHGFYGHGARQPYRELTHVPLVVSGHRVPQGVRVPYSAGMLDFFPTILDWAGATPPDYLPGASLITRDGEVAIDSDRVAFTDLDNGPQCDKWDAAIVQGDYMVTSRDHGSSYAIFNRKEDPGEAVDLVATGGIGEKKAEKLIGLLENEKSRHHALGERFGGPEWMEAEEGLSVETNEQLEALGYL